MKLLPCICGYNPSVWFGDTGEELRSVSCAECNLSTLEYQDGNRAASEWNRIQRKLRNKKEPQ